MATNDLNRLVRILVNDYPEQPIMHHIVHALSDYELKDLEFVPNEALRDSLMLYIEQLELDDSIKQNFNHGQEY